MQFSKKVSSQYAIQAGPVIDIKTGKEISKKPPPQEPFGKKKASGDPVGALLEEVQKHTSLELGRQDDVIDIERDILVNAFKMSEEEYDKMETALEKTKKKGPGYEVYAWNDNSGYDYWHKEGETGDTNYIQVTAHIKNAKSVDPKKLASDMEDVYEALKHWENV